MCVSCMPKYNIKLKLSERQAYGLEALSIQTGMDYTNIVRRAIDEHIKQNISPENKKELDELFATWDNIQTYKEKEWTDHVNNMTEQQIKLFDTTMKKGIKILDEKKNITVDGLECIPEYHKLDDLEKHRIFIRLLSIQMKRENPQDEHSMSHLLSKRIINKRIAQGNKKAEKRIKQLQKEADELQKQYDSLPDEESKKAFIQKYERELDSVKKFQAKHEARIRKKKDEKK